jgi:hypothetical protein
VNSIGGDIDMAAASAKLAVMPRLIDCSKLVWWIHWAIGKEQRMWRFGLLGLFLGTMAMAATTQPADEQVQSPAARDAVRHYYDGRVRARQIYLRSLIDADRIEIDELAKAMRLAMTNAELDEANRIQAAKDQAGLTFKEHAAELKQAFATTRPTMISWTKTFVIFASEKWQPTVDVKKGVRYRIFATGQWSGGFKAKDVRLLCGPDGMIVPMTGPEEEHGGEKAWYLEGRVGQSYPFVVGSFYEFVAKEDGPLELDMRHWWRWSGNGSLSVKIEALPDAGP